ncbi:MAG: hypothetical protein KME63_16360 [Candidatus Thiodiazotropha sp. (ex Clathrolucina costata)]|nr:hypothetical protein [Candidatus Thiodiazotropha taylori]MCG7860938.1 hypothetical protein [Candidatus Thiodiazotropha endolucinida]
MAIQDSNAERRNLTVTSIAFIAYFYAGGSFPDTSVKLQVINAEFSQPEMLAVIAWGMLVWFIYRYWQAHGGSFVNDFRSEFNEWKSRQYIKKYVASRIGCDLATDKVEGYYVTSIFWKNWYVSTSCVYATNIGRRSDGTIQSYSQGPSEKQIPEIKFTNLNGWVLALRSTMECAFKYPSFSNYIVPYILALLAVCGGLWRILF